MKRQKRLRPYVRRANGKEQSESLRVAFRLAIYQERGKPFFVMVQRGFPNLAIAVGPSKRQLMSAPLSVNFGRQSFKEWSRAVR
jgi:hypothetical protein